VVASRSLFRKYAAVLMLLVGGALVASQMIGVAFDYAEIRESATATQALEVRSAVGTIDQYLRGIERQVQEVGALPWASGLLGAEDRRHRVPPLDEAGPAIAEIRYVDGVGRERLKASRTERDEIDSLRPSESTTEVARRAPPAPTSRTCSSPTARSRS
jgi:hypothetical protein